MKYRVFFHQGDELTLKTKVSKGYASLDKSKITIEGPENINIPFKELQKVTIFRLHGLGRVIQIDHLHGRIFISVTRLMIGQFALINFFKTGRLYEALSSVLTNEK